MKASIHPQWFSDAVISCACGNRVVVGATKKEIKVEICAHCHPFFTGQMMFVDTLGRVERFQQKQKASVTTSAILAEKKKKKAEREQQLRSPKSLKDMLMGLK